MSSGTHRIDELLAEVAELRRAEMRKCEASTVDPCASRAKELYATAVVIGGGASAVAESEDCTESAIRRRVENPRLAVHLAHVIAMPADAIRYVSRELDRIASEKGMRRAG